MDGAIFFKVARLSIILLISFYGCAGAPQIIPSQPPPGVCLAPEVQLLNLPTKKACALIDRDGLVHVLVARSDQGGLLYLMIGPEGVKHEQVVTTSGDHNHLSMAFDNAGRLHAIVDDEHLMFDEGVWRYLPKGPCKVLVHGGRDLACAFWVPGEDVGAPWVWHGTIMGMTQCILPVIFPWREHRLAIAWDADGRCKDWSVFDPSTKLEPGPFWIASDRSMRVHVVYLRDLSVPLITNVSGPPPPSEYLGLAYASFDLAPIVSPDTGHANAPPVDPTQSRFSSVSGKGISELEGHFAFIQMAIDPDSGSAIVAVGKPKPASWSYLTVKNGKADLPVRFPWENCRIIGLAPAGHDCFHAITAHCGCGERPPFWNWKGDLVFDWVWGARPTGVCYHLYRDGAWSPPVEVAESAYDAIIASSSAGRALAIWIRKDKTLAGRWIEVTQ